MSECLKCGITYHVGPSHDGLCAACRRIAELERQLTQAREAAEAWTGKTADLIEENAALRTLAAKATEFRVGKVRVIQTTIGWVIRSGPLYWSGTAWGDVQEALPYVSFEAAIAAAKEVGQ